MFLRRFFIHLGRLVASLGVLWLILATLWLFLPSPAPGDIYPASALSGKTLTRVFKIEEFYKYTDMSQTVKDARATGRWYMSLDFTVLQDETTGNKSLAIDGGSDPLAKFFNNEKLQPRHNISLSFETDGVRLSQPIKLSSRTGDLDGINPTWFATADSALLFWWIHHDYATTAIRVRSVPMDNKIEIWPDAGYWYQQPPNPLPRATPHDLEPLLVIEISEDEELTFQFPSLPKSSSPSALYTTRVVVLTIIAPISILFLSVFYFFSTVLGGIMVILIGILSLFIKVVGLALGCLVLYGFVWWWRNGRPSLPFTEIGQAVSSVILAVRNREQQPAVEETGLIDLEAGVQQTEEPVVNTAVLVDVSTPKLAEPTTAAK